MPLAQCSENLTAKTFMPRYKLTIEYDGTPYKGWQKQENGASVQATIEAACERFITQPVELTVAGRTDSGVHAKGQVAHVDFPMAREPFNIREGLNKLLLPHPIAILHAEEVAPEFNARLDAKKRHYLYRILNRDARAALDATRAWHVFYPLDIAAMQEAANYLIGQHDFTSFRASECQAQSPLKTLDTLSVKRRSTDPAQVMIKTSAKSFLHHQVRNIVGTLMLVGAGKWKPEQVQEALAARDRRAGGPMAPAHGLYLMKVEY